MCLLPGYQRVYASLGNLFSALALFLLSINVKPFLPVQHVQHVSVDMSVSIYVPRAGGINGDACPGKPVSACFVQTGNAACGVNYPRGTVFVLPDDAVLAGLPTSVECIDRGGAIGKNNLDIARVSEDVKGDLRFAKNWGRRLVTVGVIKPLP